jgi:hypothetical protein
MTKRKKHVHLLVDFINSDYYRFYDEMIIHLSEKNLLLIPYQNPRLIERLDFKPDLPRGSKKQFYFELARLLQSGFSVLRRGYHKNDLYRWLADSRHSNFGASFQTIQGAVNQMIRDAFV